MPASLAQRFKDALPAGADYCSLRFVSSRDERLSVRQGIVQPAWRHEDAGAMAFVVDGAGAGYAATSDLSLGGLSRAFADAARWARLARERSLVDHAAIHWPAPRGDYRSPVERRWQDLSLADKLALLGEVAEPLHPDERIVDWEASLWWSRVEVCYLTSHGAEATQHIETIVPNLSAVAHEGGETQIRSFGGGAICRQGGLEVLDAVGYREAAPRVAEEALALLAAPNCPEMQCDLLVAPDQMVLQIHESIGHPLELDRVLGDERNYAGTTFVTPEMFGSYRYGSELLDVTFDPTLPGEMASYGFDDEGAAAERCYVIRRGVLERGLGSVISQQRLGLPGVACARATSWARPPIDRIGNLNIEPGDASLDEMIASVQRGLFVRTNCSWSIDDSRNKFQFGCEWARLIEDGELGALVKNPSYRGVSATFWRNLARVGDRSTYEVLGSPYCGKGEPNQVIRVGHASPACLFRDVAVFGGMD
ncbi:MAG: TldD/PmbA family protein [Myxococcales bacterium]|nr:TldD/PmbA family protein [Myxococcales bacterium]